MKGKLYFLDESIDTGRVVVSKSLEDDEANNFKLCHMCLGHAGEKALQRWVKQGLLKNANTGKHGFYEHCVLEKQTMVKSGTIIVGLLLLLMISQKEHEHT
jgi:hypothetical protein